VRRVTALLAATLLLALIGSPISATDAPPLLISEVHPDPRAVGDDMGEWIEIANPGPDAVNLRGWLLLKKGGGQPPIADDIWIAGGGYVVLARHPDPALNGGVQPAYVFAAIDPLANAGDWIGLAAPDKTIVDEVAWGEGTGLVVYEGASLERTAADRAAPWVVSHSPWPGSAGDRGSPGAAYAPPPSPTPIPTPTPLATAPPAVPPRVLLSELLIDPAAVADDQGEWIEVANLEPVAVNLTGWVLHDDRGERAVLSGDVWVAAGGYAVLARDADPAANGGVGLAGLYSGLRLANDGDALHLVTPWGVEVDSLSWGRVAAGASLERTGFAPDALWVPAALPWPGSAGDLGSPGAPYIAPPTPTATAPPTATLPPTPTLAPTPAPSTPPILLSELLIAPSAVPDKVGEWVELYNAGTEAVNLAGWVLADEDGETAVIAGDAWLSPGGYGVLARSGDPAANGGVSVLAVYAGLQLADDGDELLLLTPWGAVADRLSWGRVPAGASLERVPTGSMYGPGDLWVPAQTLWPGSTGDRGSPGAAYTPPPAATPAPTPTLAPGEWPIAVAASSLRINEVGYDGAADEFIVLRNATASPLELSGWRLGDGEGLVTLPALTLPPGALWVAARDGERFTTAWGRRPDAEWSDADPAVPDLLPASGDLALADDGDEVLLLNPAGEIADVIAYGDAGAIAGLTGAVRASAGHSLHLAGDAAFPTVRDMRHRAWSAPPTPFDADGLPGAVALSAVNLDGGLLAVWGSLGSQSAFSPGGTLPPHMLAAAAASQGLEYLAVADTDRDPRDFAAAAPVALTLLPAWRWTGDASTAAIVYSDVVAHNANAAASLGAPIQALGANAPPAGNLVAIAGDAAAAPGDLGTLVKAWRSAGAPLLPAGNSTPPLPGVAPAAPRYTGLAVAGRDVASLLDALTQRRGWLTSAPGLWLTLRTDDGAWMGATVPAAGDLTLHIVYGDRSGQTAGLALWQDGDIIRRLDTPAPDGRWSVRVDALPGNFLYAVATQFDGDFAVTAPLLVVGDPAPVEPAPLPPPAQQADDDEPDPIPAAAAGQATGAPGSLAQAKWRGLALTAEFRGQVVVPPGLFNSVIYVAEPATDANGAALPIAGLGVQVYLKQGDFLPMREGDWVLVRGEMRSFRGEMEVQLSEPGQAWPIGPGVPLLPLPVTVAAIGESLEGRFVTFEGVITGWRGDSLLLGDPATPDAPPVRVTVRSSLDWKRPYVHLGERYRVTGIVSQFATAAPWNDGYRVLVRYPSDLLKLASVSAAP
jgi:hypothetical protein